MRRVLAAIYAISALVLGSLAALVLGTVGVLPFVVVPRGRRERWAIHAAALWSDLMVRGALLARPKVTGSVDLPGKGGALFLCNHRSWLDPMLLIRWTHSQGLSKALVFWIPFVGIFGWLTGAVFFNRGSPEQRKRARDETMWLVRQGARVHVFPEGTRSRDGEIGPRVHLTLPRDCFAAGVPVVPCAVYGTERTLPPDHVAAWPMQPCRLDIGPALYPNDFPDADAFAEACWDAVVERFERLREEAGDAPAIPTSRRSRSSRLG